MNSSLQRKCPPGTIPVGRGGTHCPEVLCQGRYRMEEAKRSHRFSIDGYEISASFSDKKNPAAIRQARDILLKTFAVGILDVPGRGSYNGYNRTPLAP